MKTFKQFVVEDNHPLMDKRYSTLGRANKAMSQVRKETGLDVDVGWDDESKKYKIQKMLDKPHKSVDIVKNNDILAKHLGFKK